MGKKFCGYCGELLEANCRCEIIAKMEEEDYIKELEDRPETQAGWAFEDLMANSHLRNQ